MSGFEVGTSRALSVSMNLLAKLLVKNLGPWIYLHYVSLFGCSFQRFVLAPLAVILVLEVPFDPGIRDLSEGQIDIHNGCI